MQSIRKNTCGAFAAASLIFLSGCAGMTRQEQGTVTGAAIGGVAGHVLGGGVLGTAAGAAVGGVIGHEVTRPERERERARDRR
jgi:osmotically inducible lipoprotein OsmB